MNYETGDYLLFEEGRNSKNKPIYGLMKLSGVDGKVMHGHLAKNSHIKALRKQVEVKKRDVVLNLGQNPKPGSVYGQDVSKLYKFRNTHDDFGTLYFFLDMEDNDKADLLSTFTKVHKQLTQLGLDFIVDPTTTIWEILPYNGEKYAGMYMQSRKPDVRPSVAQIRPYSSEKKRWRYIVLHELAHRIDFNYLAVSHDARKLRADWVRLYKSSILPEQVDREQCKALRTKLLDQEECPSAFMSQLEEDEKKQFKMILAWFRSVYSLSPREIDALWDGDYRDDIKEIWPARVSKKGLDPIISEYATTNVSETIAEAISYYLTKQSLPKHVVKLVEKTLSWVKTQKE